MKQNVLFPAGDPMGAAIFDYHKNGAPAGKLVVHSSMFEDDEIPVDALFRSFAQMPVLEQTALRMAEGRILDVGAGSGCHCLALKEMGKNPAAIDISPLSVAVMTDKGIDARLMNLYDDKFKETFDTVLMLMNGSGIIGRLENMPAFFKKMKQILAPGGCILMDSSDLRYLYEDEDGSFEIDLADEYYGLLDYQMEYVPFNKKASVLGKPFDWLYVDFDTLSYYAEQNGFKAELVAEGEHYDYLAKLTVGI
jgi:SAM-dependent methyltransferase